MTCSLSASPDPTPSVNSPPVQHRAGRRGLGDDRRVDAHRRAGHRGRDRQRAHLATSRRSSTRRTGSGPARRSTGGSGRRSTATRTRPPAASRACSTSSPGRVLLAGQEVADLHACLPRARGKWSEVRAHGVITNLTAPSAFFWNFSYASGRRPRAGGGAWRTSRRRAGRSIVEQRHDVVDPPLDVGLAHPQLDLLVEQLQHRQRVGGAPVHAAERDRPAAADDVDRECRARPAGRCRRVSISGLRQRVREQPTSALREPAVPVSRGPPCRRRR